MDALTRGGSTKAVDPVLAAGANAPAHERLTALTVLVMAIATPVSIGFHYVSHYYWGLGYPWATFMVDPVWRFNDYLLPYRDALRFHPGLSSNLVYSPLMHLLMTALTVLTPRAGFAIVVGVFLFVLAVVCWKWITAAATMTAVRLQQVAVLMLLSYPVLFVVDRGNLEMVVFVFLAAFFYLYYGRHSRWAWIPLALAIGSKYYWVTLLVLPLSDRQMRQALYAALGAVGVSLAAVLLIAWHSHYAVGAVMHSWLQALAGRAAAYGLLHTVQHAHTLWASIQLSNRVFTGLDGIGNLDRSYFLVAALLFVLIAYKVLTHDLAPWRKVLALVSATVVLPLENFDYTLIHLYFPLALLVCCGAVGRRARVAALLIGVCLVPVDYYYFAVGDSFNRAGVIIESGISTLIYCGALVALILVALMTRGRERRSLRSTLVWDSWSAAGGAPGAGTAAPGAATNAGGLP